MSKRTLIIFPSRLRRFLDAETGAILVEFSLVLPVMLLFFAVAVESTRMFWSYQTAISGVRDAGRYLARVAPVDICLSGGSLAGYAGSLKQIVEKDIGGTTLLPSTITINSVTPSLTCVTGSYRVNPAPIATVTANMTIQFPFGSILGLFGSGLTSTTTTITDQSRIFGQ
ncbi:TadE/TadG family type IV pilus assembly protein [Pseudohalocynthiibacter sp. F2068]|jgi:Flp pilus assembly protein TadG|uniref:TadE/TadG family type IV pilus assembly protein n=1 Tax=Pseudohalocynthiibacter sp. F2068 TaxID=2926418 RepID=UPI001FF1D382|nr:TadE/TadG family type IV pilus assembly protein [Pseudohalocynthiibacter sp. F2068]MCK0104206.1 pilus assembly protein [Pseudohalocynthiibacter sp. F2068]